MKIYTLFDYIEEYACNTPEQYVLQEENRGLSYYGLKQCLIRNKKILEENGVKANKCYLLFSHDQYEYFIKFLSLLYVGCFVIPLPDDITEYEKNKILKIVDAKELPECELSYEFNLSINYFEKLLIQDDNNFGIYHLTSGTTEDPRLCIRTAAGLVTEGRSFKKTFLLNSGERIFSTSPLYHSYSLGAALITCIVAGASLYCTRIFSPRKTLKLIQQKKITFLILVPATARALCDTYTKEIFDFSSVHIALVGAGAIDKKLYENFKNKFKISLLSNYGSTETGAAITRVSSVPYQSIGKPMDGVTVKICNEKGKEVGIGEEGEIYLKSNAMFVRYVNSPSESVFNEDGFFNTGDIAFYDNNGYIYIVGRKKIMINVGGKKVNPYEVEDVISNYEGVEECVVVGVKNSFREERVLAFVVGENVDPEEIKKFCSYKLSKYKLPVNIKLCKYIPKSSTGKKIRDLSQLEKVCDRL